MNQLKGKFKTMTIDSCIESISLRFSPNYIPLKQRWRNNGLSADFLGDYVSCFYPKENDDQNTISRQAEIKSAVTYIANELIENAMKYTNPLSKSVIILNLILTKTEVIFDACNPLSQTQLELYQKFIDNLMDNDPEQLYLDTLEKVAMTESGSGLGCLTMINDYEAKLAWKFISDESTHLMVHNQVIITI